MSFKIQTSDSRKRSRNDVPSDILGVPNDLAPFLTVAIVETTKAMQNVLTVLSNNHEEGECDPGCTSRASRTTGNALDNVLNRFHAATEVRDEKQKRRVLRMKVAITAWESALQSRSGNRKYVHKGDQVMQKADPSIHMASFLHVWNLQQHAIVPVRRASLYIASHLLETNEECRSYWKENYILKWVNWVVEGKFLEQHSGHIQLWQSEAQLLLSRLVTTIPDPQIRVGLRFLRQRCPRGTSEGFENIDSSLSGWRHVRDFAMLHGEKEIEICERLILKAHSCMDVLMPRIGEVTTSSVSQNRDRSKEYTGDDDEGSEDEDVNWEEGDEEVAAGAHEAAVERTLEIMQSTGELLGGDLEINLQQQSQFQPHQWDQGTEGQKINLSKVIHSLSTRHMPRLSSWVNALTNADNLIQAPGQTALVTISTNAVRSKGNLLRRLWALKSRVTSVLSSFAKLNKECSNHAVENGLLRPKTASLEGLSNFPRRFDDHPKSTTRSRRTSKPMVSKRIQIKFKTFEK